jgi:predicted MFS family arabinose efflux permease
MVAIGVLFVGKIITLSIVDRFKSNISGAKLFMIGAALIAPLPAMWAVSQDIYFIYALQFISGMTWACCEVGLSLIFFKDLRHDEKVPVTTVYNLLNSLAIIVGTLIGGKVLSSFGQNLQSYAVVFVAGSAARLLAAGSLYYFYKSSLQEEVPLIASASAATEQAS